jgi:hypothetical protein
MKYPTPPLPSSSGGLPRMVLQNVADNFLETLLDPLPSGGSKHGFLASLQIHPVS